MLKLTGANINVENVWRVAYEREPVELASEARARILESRAYIEDRLKTDEAIYGVNTGFGAFSSVRISNKDIIQLQKNFRNAIKKMKEKGQI